jgi:hypothetical protein
MFKVQHGTPKVKADLPVLTPELEKIKNKLLKLHQEGDSAGRFHYIKSLDEDVYEQIRPHVQPDPQKKVEEAYAKQLERWHNSQDFIQAWMRRQDPNAKFFPQWLAGKPKPEHPNVIAAKQAAKDKAYWDTFDGGTIASELPD